MKKIYYLKITLILSINIISNQVFGQKIKYQYSKLEVGTYIKTGQPVIADVIKFEAPLLQIIKPDSTSTLFFQFGKWEKNKLYTKSTGYLAKTNLHALIEKKPFEWVIPKLNINQITHFASSNHLIEVESKLLYGKSFATTKLIDNQNGKSLLSFPGYPFYIHNDITFVLREDINKAGTNITAINLNTSRVLWSLPFKTQFGINQLLNFNDSTLFISSEGLHSFNIYNGFSWHHKLNTGDRTYNFIIKPKSFGIPGNYINGQFIGIKFYNGLYNRNSNILSINKSLFYASSKEIIKVNAYSGIKEWTIPLPTKYMSTSCLYESEEKEIILFNKSIAKYNGNHVQFGKPFIAKFKISNGEKLFARTIPIEINEYIKDHLILNGFMYILTNNRIFKTDLLTGYILTEISLQDNIKYYGFLPGDVYIKDQNKLYKVKSLYEGVQLFGEKVTLYSEDLTIQPNDLQLKDFYFENSISDKMYNSYYTYIKDKWHKGKTYITNKNNELLFSIDRINNDEVQLINGIIYFYNKDQVFLISEKR